MVDAGKIFVLVLSSICTWYSYTHTYTLKHTHTHTHTNTHRERHTHSPLSHRRNLTHKMRQPTRKEFRKPKKKKEGG